MDDVVDRTLSVKGIRIGWQLIIADKAVELQPESLKTRSNGLMIVG